MITVMHVNKKFGTKDALKDVSLTANNGEITALVGINGAGKSTTINIIANYIAENSGTVERGTLSIMPDADNLYATMTGKYFLQYMSRLKNADFDQAVQLSVELGLSQDLAKKIKSYSFGMKKKIAFIAAYIGEFDNYIFDEPTSGVDFESAKIMMDLIDQLKSAGRAIMLTSHNLDEIQDVSNHVYYLSDGEVYTQDMVTIGAVGYHVKTLTDLPDLTGIFSNDENVQVNSHHELTFRADEKTAAHILTALIARGTLVSQFTPIRSKVEEIMDRLENEE